jgi:Cytochrome P450
VSGGHPLLGHTIGFLRDPVAVVERGHRECGEAFALRLGGRNAVVLLGPEANRFFFAETDGLLSIRTRMPFFPRMFDPDFYLFADAEEYRRQRDIVLPRFKGRAPATHAKTGWPAAAIRPGCKVGFYTMCHPKRHECTNDPRWRRIRRPSSPGCTTVDGGRSVVAVR